MPIDSTDSNVGRRTTAAELHLSEVDSDRLAYLAQRGDELAFSELDRRFRPRLLAALRPRFDGRFADAEDVVQDALMKSWQRMASYDATQPFAAWLYTIAFRTATDQLRRSQRRSRHEQQLSRTVMPNAVNADRLEAKNSAKNLWTLAKRELSESQFEAMWLRYAEELSVRSIAQVMGKTRVGVRVLLHRGRSTLQACAGEVTEL